MQLSRLDRKSGPRRRIAPIPASSPNSVLEQNKEDELKKESMIAEGLFRKSQEENQEPSSFVTCLKINKINRVSKRPALFQQVPPNIQQNSLESEQIPIPSVTEDKKPKDSEDKVNAVQQDNPPAVKLKRNLPLSDRGKSSPLRVSVSNNIKSVKTDATEPKQMKQQELDSNKPSKVKFFIDRFKKAPPTSREDREKDKKQPLPSNNNHDLRKSQKNISNSQIFAPESKKSVLSPPKNNKTRFRIPPDENFKPDDIPEFGEDTVLMSTNSLAMSIDFDEKEQKEQNFKVHEPIPQQKQNEGPKIIENAKFQKETQDQLPVNDEKKEDIRKQPNVPENSAKSPLISAKNSKKKSITISVSMKLNDQNPKKKKETKNDNIDKSVNLKSIFMDVDDTILDLDLLSSEIDFHSPSNAKKSFSDAILDDIEDSNDDLSAFLEDIDEDIKQSERAVKKRTEKPVPKKSESPLIAKKQSKITNTTDSLDIDKFISDISKSVNELEENEKQIEEKLKKSLLKEKNKKLQVSSSVSIDFDAAGIPLVFDDNQNQKKEEKDKKNDEIEKENLKNLYKSVEIQKEEQKKGTGLPPKSPPKILIIPSPKKNEKNEKPEKNEKKKEKESKKQLSNIEEEEKEVAMTEDQFFEAVDDEIWDNFMESLKTGFPKAPFKFHVFE